MEEGVYLLGLFEAEGIPGAEVELAGGSGAELLLAGADAPYFAFLLTFGGSKLVFKRGCLSEQLRGLGLNLL